MRSGVQLVDAWIVVVYLGAIAAVGVYFSRRQTTLDEYFRARQTMAVDRREAGEAAEG
jgi:Na+/proline symporter